MSIAIGSGVECFTMETHASRAFLETTNAITFMDEDMEIEYPDHRRSLYLTATINSVQVRRVLIDIGASLNLIALSTIEAISTAGKRFLFKILFDRFLFNLTWIQFGYYHFIRSIFSRFNSAMPV